MLWSVALYWASASTVSIDRKVTQGNTYSDFEGVCAVRPGRGLPREYIYSRSCRNVVDDSSDVNITIHGTSAYSRDSARLQCGKGTSIPNIIVSSFMKSLATTRPETVPEWSQML